MIVMMIRDISLIILSFLAAIMLTFNLFENNNKKGDNDPPLPKINGRKFEGIVVEYPPAELCTYPEYRNKPYFSIKYEENGEHIIGYGTYNPDVLSRYLKEYFITPTIIEADKKYETKVITRGNCMMCGKELTNGLFFCKECENKANSRK